MRRRIIGLVITTILFFNLNISSQAQSFNYYFKRGKKYYKYGAYDKAIADFKRAARMKKGNADVTYYLGLANLAGGDKKVALKNIEKVYQLDPKLDKEIAYYLGLAYQYQYEFEKAIKVYTKYRDLKKKNANKATKKIKECEFGMLTMQRNHNIEVVNMGETINSPYNDYTPLIAPNGRFLILTSNRKGSTGGLRMGDGSYYEDIYISHKRNGSWTDPQKISPQINLKYHDAAGSLSPDGNSLFLYYERGGGNIYEAKKTNNIWAEPIKLSDKINSVFWETSATITADGKTLYFSSDRPGGIGDLDIYKCTLDENGEWSTPQNLGPTINTRYSEDAPYISPDGNILYFGSSGHTGMGDSDIFYSKMVNGRFQEPVNMGHPVNSVYSDNYFSLSPDRKKGYYASLREGGMGEADIYEITFNEWPDGDKPIETPAEEVIASNEEPEPVVEEPVVEEPTEEVATVTEEPETVTEVEEEPVTETPAAVVTEETPEPDPVVEVEETPVIAESTSEPVAPAEQVEEATATYFDENFINEKKKIGGITVLKGKVVDAEDATPLYATLKLVDNEANTVLAEITSDPNSGEFELIIPHGGNYGVSTARPGYLFNSINFNLPENTDMPELDTHIILQKAQVGSKIVLKNIFFDTGKADLRTESLGELAQIKTLLADNPELSVQINGHTDNVGNNVYNKVLSKKRAQSVVDYLVSHDIEPLRVLAKGYGEERPLVSNDDERDGREINRRTEIEIVGIAGVGGN